MELDRHARDLRASAVLVLLLAVLVIPGSSPVSGPALLTLTPTHGVHLADLGVVALGLLVLLVAHRKAGLRRLAGPALGLRPLALR